MIGPPVDPDEMARTLTEYREATAALRRALPDTDESRTLEQRVAELEAEIRSWPLRHGDTR
jgi:hypothetical protein